MLTAAFLMELLLDGCLRKAQLQTDTIASLIFYFPTTLISGHKTTLIWIYPSGVELMEKVLKEPCKTIKVSIRIL